MSLLSFNWLKSPADREIIRKWTTGAADAAYELALPSPGDRDCFEFLVLGDTGDSEAGGTGTSPQDAVARFLAEDAAPPVGSGRAEFVLHLGDVVYMTGERRLYDPNFRRPYAPFLTPESTVENLVFRLPFLPVPGNHDYYDFARWASMLTRLPVLGSGVRAVAEEFFAFRVPEGGSGMGRAFMEAFVNGSGAAGGALPYVPGQQTRLPNRYYQFRFGCADFFALDSNTLDSPPPSASAARVRREARDRVRALEGRARILDYELKRDETALERWSARRRARAAADPALRERIAAAGQALLLSLQEVDRALANCGTAPACSRAVRNVHTASSAWSACLAELTVAADARAARRALDTLARDCVPVETALKRMDECLAELPEGPAREQALSARDAAAAALKSWGDTLYGPLPAPLCTRIRTLSEGALDVQRELARERQRMHHRPEDFDHAQIEWLDAALTRSQRERPDAWRVLFLHHPLYTTIGNHCEHPDVQGVRENLLPLLEGRVDLVFTGHSHAFEWIRSDRVPHAGVFVSGGGGQVSLRQSILDPERFPRSRSRYEALRRAGALESASAGRGPTSPDGSGGPLYHYLRVRVRPDRIEVIPVGVRRLRRGVYRREEPMPVFHAAELGPSQAGAPPREERLLAAVEVRRGAPPHAVWQEP